MSRYLIGRGDIVHASLDPAQGHEQAGHRPHLVLSRQEYERMFGMVIAVPLTHSPRNWPTRVMIAEGSYAICEQPRTLAVSRITKVDRRGLTDKADQVAAIIHRLVNPL